MESNYLLLGFLWITYCALHSFLASTSLKNLVKKKDPVFSRYYRFAYSVFSTVALAPLIYFQYSFRSPELISSIQMKYVSILFLLVPGVIIMAVSIFKYFKLLSGIRSLFQPLPPVCLELGGIHRFVRHPLYLGTLLFLWGLFFIFSSVNNLIAALIITFYIVIGIQLEEKKLISEFGEVYIAYIKRVPALIPRLKKQGNKKG